MINRLKGKYKVTPKDRFDLIKSIAAQKSQNINWNTWDDLADYAIGMADAIIGRLDAEREENRNETT